MSFDEALKAIVRAAVREAMSELRFDPPAPVDELLTLREAAALGKISRSKLRTMLRDGRIPKRGDGRSVRVRRDELLRALGMETKPGRGAEMGLRVARALRSNMGK